ncbi:MAG: hypothetical protein FK731_08645 [Asgard group archaeon]|nr:hypothetical protein [Asgard group archaeon]
MKYSLTKQTNKKSLVELFLMLSDSIDEEVPDIIWEGSEFEVVIDQPDVKCDINYVSTNKGGEFNIKVSWITTAAKKQKAKEAEKKAKEKIEKSKEKAGGTKPKPKAEKPVELVADEELWLEDEENWDVSADDPEWDSEDYDDEW